MIKVSFDFDGTLSRQDVQLYAEELLDKGDVEVWVTTTRYDDNHAKLPNHNTDLYRVIDKLGIPRDRIHFTNMEWKANYLKDNKFLWHLDDYYVELKEISKANACVGIAVIGSSTWRSKCNRLIDVIKFRNG